jgi:predicted dehydrogenase
MKRIVCIGGWGHWGEVFKTLETYQDAQLCGVAPAYSGENLDTICGHRLMKGVPRFETIRQMVSVTKPDVAIVSSLPGYIAAAVIQAAEAGLDVISEKPLGITLDENRAIERAVKLNNVKLTAIFSMRTLPVFQTARRLYRDGVIGKAVLINVRKSYKYGDEEARPEWFGQRAVYGGTFPWIGIHALDMISFITGLGARQVAALQCNQIHFSRPDCEDTCCAVLELDGGVQATVSVDYFRPQNAGTHGDDWIRIVGTEGIIEARDNEGTCMLLKHDAAPQSMPLDDPESIFIPFLEDRDGLIGSEEALALTKASLYARQAADEKKWMEIL